MRTGCREIKWKEVLNLGVKGPRQAVCGLVELALEFALEVSLNEGTTNPTKGGAKHL